MAENKFPQSQLESSDLLLHIACWGIEGLKRYTTAIQGLENAKDRAIGAFFDITVASWQNGERDCLLKAFAPSIASLADCGWKGVEAAALYHALRNSPIDREKILTIRPEAADSDPRTVVRTLIANCRP